MRKIIFSMAITMLLFVLLPAFVLATPTTNKLDIHPSEQLAGFYDIFVQKGGQWQHAGILRYNKYLRERRVDLGPFLPAGEPAKIRLVQKGGGAAHIDSVLLGGVPPSNVAGSYEKLALKKLLKRDFDVLDAFEKSLELNFTGINQDKILKLTARVEPKTISNKPFQFPTANLFTSVNKHSRFYTYSLKSESGSLSENKTKNSEKPFFKVLCQTDSGHPNGFTYGWVTNDDKSLYVDLDFTPDNTRDGNLLPYTLYNYLNK